MNKLEIYNKQTTKSKNRHHWEPESHLLFQQLLLGMITLSTTQLRFRRDFGLVFADLALQSLYHPQKSQSFGSYNRRHPKKKPEENQSENKNHFTPPIVQIFSNQGKWERTKVSKTRPTQMREPKKKREKEMPRCSKWKLPKESDAKHSGKQ